MAHGTARHSGKGAGEGLRRADYRVLGLPLTIEADSPGLLAAFDTDYALFRSRPPRPGKGLRITARLSPAEGTPRLEVRAAGRTGEGPREVPLKPHGDPVRAACRALLRELFAHLDGFLVLHAGVVAAPGCAVVVAGPPGAGKTTLVLELAAAGLAFLSDDFCPIERASGLVHPFPRSPWVVGTGRRAGNGSRPRKRPLPPPAGPGAAEAGPLPPGVVVVLDPGGEPERRRVVELGVAPGALATVREELEALGGDVQVEAGGTALPALRVSYPRGAGLSARVREVLERHAGDIPELFRVDAVRPRFDRAPALAPLPRHEAALALLSDAKHAPWERARTPGAGDSPAALLMELAGLLGGADCHRLTVGRLEGMRDLVLSLAGVPGSRGGTP